MGIVGVGPFAWVLTLLLLLQACTSGEPPATQREPSSSIDQTGQAGGGGGDGDGDRDAGMNGGHDAGMDGGHDAGMDSAHDAGRGGDSDGGGPVDAGPNFDAGPNTDAATGCATSCDSPPAEACPDAQTLRAYDPTGSCVAGACEYTYTDLSCDDSDLCTTGDACSAGACITTGSLVCAGHGDDPCVADLCDPATGCGSMFTTVACDDGDACTTGDACDGGSCLGAGSLGCSDNAGDPCVLDDCDSGTGCVTINTTAACDDGSVCTTGDVCADGSCTSTGSLTCDANAADPCLQDYCHASSGCMASHTTAGCDDGNACTVADACAGGTCQPGTNLVCDANRGDPCIQDYCDPSGGCATRYTTVDCDDQDACTATDSCGAGVCTGSGDLCSPRRVGGTVSGLWGTLVLNLNGSEDLTVTRDGSFAFALDLYALDEYQVSVVSAPHDLDCGPTNHSGTIGNADVTDLGLVCQPRDAVAAGSYHSCALIGGEVTCWGAGQSVGTSPDLGQSMVPPGLGPLAFLDAGYRQSCVLGSDGDVNCFGDNDYGQSALPPGLDTLTRISTGGEHACAVDDTHLVTCWGRNDYGQRDVPADLSNTRIVAAGNLHTCALDMAGAVRCWGAGQAGDGGYDQSVVPPDLGTIVDVVAGGAHTCTLDTAGEVSCWGRSSLNATAVPGSLGTVVDIAAGWSHTCALWSTGRVSCWGWNQYGQTDVPAYLPAAASLAASMYHTCVLLESGTVTCWGDDRYDQLLPPGELGAPCGSTPNGGTEMRVRYQYYQVTEGNTCQSQDQTRTCRNGVWDPWDGPFTNVSCTVIPFSGSCVSRWGGSKVSCVHMGTLDATQFESWCNGSHSLALCSTSGALGVCRNGLYETWMFPYQLIRNVQEAAANCTCGTCTFTAL